MIDGDLADFVSRPLLVVGVPRSGTTWVSKALALGLGARFLNEPDNELLNAFALRAKLPLGRFPVLAPGDDAPRDYAKLWDRALAGFWHPWSFRTELAKRLIRHAHRNGQIAAALCWRQPPNLELRAAARLARAPSARNGHDSVLAKTVHAPLAVEWIASRSSPRVVVVTRHPLNVVSSWLDLRYRDSHLDIRTGLLRRFHGMWDLRLPADNASPLARVAWEVGLLMSGVQVGLRQHPEWIEVSHDELCLDVGGFRRLFDRLGIKWPQTRVSDYLNLSDRPEHDPWSTYRVTREQPQRWRRSLSDQQIDEIAGVLSDFPLLQFDFHTRARSGETESGGASA